MPLVRRQRGVAHAYNLAVAVEEIYYLQRVLDVPFNAQRQRLQTLQQHEGVKRTYGCPVSRSSVALMRVMYAARPAASVNTRPWYPASGLVSCSNFCPAFQSKFPPSTITPPNEVPCPPMNFVAECTTCRRRALSVLLYKVCRRCCPQSAADCACGQCRLWPLCPPRQSWGCPASL